MNLKDKIGKELSEKIEDSFYSIESRLLEFISMIRFYRMIPYEFHGKLSDIIRNHNRKTDNKVIMKFIDYLRYEITINIKEGFYLFLQIKFVHKRNSWVIKYTRIIITDENGVILEEIYS